MGTEILVIGSLLVVSGVLIIIIILLLANLGAYFMKIPQGTTVFISAGDSLKSILPNIGGYRMSNVDDLDGRHWLIPAKDENEKTESFFHKSLTGTVWFQKWLWKRFGVKFISLFWPHTHIHEFDMRKGGRRRIAARTELGPDTALKSRLVDSEGSTLVDSLLFLVPRPVYVEGVDLAGDNSRINLLLLPVYRQVIPALPVYYLKGDFFTLLDAAIEAAMVDFFAQHRVAVYKNDGDKSGKKKGEFAENSYDPPEDESGKGIYEERYEASPLTYAHWLKLTKGDGSPLGQKLRRLNVSRMYLQNLEKEKGEKNKQEIIDYIKKNLLLEELSDLPENNRLAKIIPSGIVPRFGFALVSFRIVEWEVHESTKKLAEALLAKETESHAAEGVRKKAEGDRDADVSRAQGDASRYRLPIEALTQLKVTPDVAAGVLAAQLRTENMRDSKTLTTYVEGGASASVMVSASPQTSTK